MCFIFYIFLLYLFIKKRKKFRRVRFVSEEQNYFCLKSEIKNVSKYGKVMLTWAVISTNQLISSFLVMLHLTVFCLNQLWRTARTWKFLRRDGRSLNSLWLLPFERVLVPLCPHFISLLPDFFFSCPFAWTARNRRGKERQEWLPSEQDLYLRLKNRIPCSALLFDFRGFFLGICLQWKKLNGRVIEASQICNAQQVIKHHFQPTKNFKHQESTFVES